MIDQEDRWWKDEPLEGERVDATPASPLRQELIDRVPVRVETSGEPLDISARERDQVEPTEQSALGAALERMRILQSEINDAQLEIEGAFQDAIERRGLPYRFRGDEAGQFVADNVVVLRSNGSVEDGWRAKLTGETVKLEKVGSEGDYEKTYPAERWVAYEQDRIADALRPQFDHMVKAYPDVWSRDQESDMYRVRRCFVWSETAREMLVGAAHIFPKSMTARVVFQYPGASQDMAKNVLITEFICWQSPGNGEASE